MRPLNRGKQGMQGKQAQNPASCASTDRQALGGVPEQDGADLQGGAPLVFEDVKADAAQFVDVWMIDLCKESDLAAGR